MRKWQAIVLGLFLMFSSSPLLADQGNITVTINNTSPDDLIMMLGSSDNLDPIDAQIIEKKIIYAGRLTSFTLGRSAYPARLFIMFQSASTEGSDANLNVGRWEYIETDNIDDPCHRVEFEYPYTIICYGTQDLPSPDIRLAIGKSGPAIRFPAP